MIHDILSLLEFQCKILSLDLLLWKMKLFFCFLVCFFVFFSFFLRLHLQHMEVPGLELELQVPAYTTATATPDPSHVCDLHHSVRQHQIFNLQSKARD